MEFCVYMLECSDGSVYVGHTEDLEARLAAHRSRLYGGYTAKRLPVRLILAEGFPTRDEAFAAERRLKGWRRSKKLALARGDWAVVKELASIRSPERRAGVRGSG
ncbi:MAG TPA: GIY-YIG nuclease family protein [Dehalococcoidia bacterium]|nr:GIY-YIG nuclease family protein [Dehalococcoidia bacterium]